MVKIKKRKSLRAVCFSLSAICLLLLCSSTFFQVGCEAAKEPRYYDILEVSGTPREMGYQHGRHFSSKIRSLYTQLLKTSLFPYLGRERPVIASVLSRYKDPLYDNGQFAYQVLLQSGQNLLNDIPDSYEEEMRGIADGAGLPFEQILVLNTFADTLLGIRSISLFIRLMGVPRLLSIEFKGPLASDGLDNDGDGEIDEGGEGLFEPFEPKPIATMVEIPVDTEVVFILEDSDGVDPSSIRIRMNEDVYVLGDSSVKIKTFGDAGEFLEVVFRPDKGFPEAKSIALVIQAGDLSLVKDPLPSHANFMPPKRITFTTKGFDKKPYEVENRGEGDGFGQPTPIGFALRDTATTDGRILAAHHFALLDSNTSHKHTALIIHRPNDGIPHVILGWVGVIWGFSGMNSDGLVWIANYSDTLDNPIIKNLLMTKILCSGVPIGIMGREVLANDSTVKESVDHLKGMERTFGWNVLLADKDRQMAVVEMDSNIFENDDNGFYTYTSDPDDTGNRDAWGRMLASVKEYDLRIGIHFQKNVQDTEPALEKLKIFPQRYWTNYYLRSLRPFYILGEKIEEGYGQFDVSKIIDVLRIPDLVDQRDSMNAVVFDPEALKLHFAMGQVPATSGPFIEFDLREALDKIED